MSISKSWYKFSFFNIPYWNKSSIISRYYIIKLIIIKCEWNRKLMRCLNFFLCMKEPAIDFPRSKQNIICKWIKHNWGKPIFWSILNFVKNSLNSGESSVPNVNDLISPKRNQMMSFFIHS
jgi:hypothetical protein